MATTDLSRFRFVSLAEGVSYLALLGVAMPLKYAAGMPMAVSVAGMVHGLLFVAFVMSLFAVATADQWRMKRSAIAMVAALLPFGAFWLERRLRRSMAEPDQAQRL